MTIRRAMSADVPALTALAGELGYPNDAEEIASRLTALRASGNDDVFVAEEDGEVEGWMHVGILISLEAEASAEIRGLVVTERRRSHGVGARLIRMAEEWARERGMTRLRVRTNVNRNRTHAFYEREGFLLKKTSRVYEKGL